MNSVVKSTLPVKTQENSFISGAIACFSCKKIKRLKIPIQWSEFLEHFWIFSKDGKKKFCYGVYFYYWNLQITLEYTKRRFNHKKIYQDLTFLQELCSKSSLNRFFWNLNYNYWDGLPSEKGVGFRSFHPNVTFLWFSWPDGFMIF